MARLSWCEDTVMAPLVARPDEREWNGMRFGWVYISLEVLVGFGDGARA